MNALRLDKWRIRKLAPADLAVQIVLLCFAI